MTYLQLVNRARRECGVSGSDLPTLVGALSAEGQRFKDWVGDAWRDLQMLKGDWTWMRATGGFNTVAAQGTYSPTDMGIANIAEYRLGSFTAYLASVGYSDEQVLPFMDHDTFREVYRFGANRTLQSRPVVVSVAQNHDLDIGPLPDDAYGIAFEYFRQPTDLTLDADDPAASGNDLPARFHMLLVYRAMMSYASYESAPEVMDRAAREHRRLLNQLIVWGAPVLTSGPPLA